MSQPEEADIPAVVQDISENGTPGLRGPMSQVSSPKTRAHRGFGPFGQGGPTLAEQEMLLRPLPLLDNSIPMQQEPQLLKAFKRTLLQARMRRLNEMENQCPHTKVENWVCQECNNKVSSFGCIFDSFKGKVRTFMKVVYENDFLEDFQNAGNINDDESDNAGSKTVRQSNDQQTQIEGENPVQQNPSQPPEVIYQQYQPANVTELREYMLFTICKKLKKQYKKQNQSILGPGHVNHLSNKLIGYLQEIQNQKKKLAVKYANDILFFDSIFESGNLLQAEMINSSEYQLYMQVDTNTRGHQQWFYFRVRNTRKNRKYVFRIMNFTKQGLTSVSNNGGQPNSGGAQIGGNMASSNIPSAMQGSSKKQDHLQKIHFKSKLCQDTEWRVIDSDQIEFIKTNVARKRKDILAAAADSDQDEMNEAEIEMMDHATSQKCLKQKSLKKKKAQYYYALQFEVQFTHNNDSVYFVYSLPYTLTEMTEMILEKEAQFQSAAHQDEDVKSSLNDEMLENDGTTTDRQPIIKPQQQNAQGQNPSQAQAIQGGTPVWQENGVTIEVENRCLFYKREILARSICGLPLYQITISKDSKSYKKKPLIIITSRVHAAETPGSFVFDGIYNFLCSNLSEAKFLRKFYTFVLVPTLNPDGVVCGNYRSSISGVDLNRQWIQPDEEYQPEIFSIKQLMKNFYERERRQMWIYCDLHGHSKKKNSFFYGCNTAANGGFLSWTIVRLLPRIFAQKTHLFNYRDCRFKVEPYKLGTGRVVAWKQFMITHSFTLESSFYGYDFGEDEHKLFTEREYSEVGTKFCQSIFELHFLWKSIRNELKLTNGWLKPRKLIEITGVPAAQILFEELQKKKKEELKRKAIEQYEQFLKKFYNKGGDTFNTGVNSQNNQPRRLSKLLQMPNIPYKSDMNVGSSQLIAASKLATVKTTMQSQAPIGALKSNVNQVEQIKSRNRELIGANSEHYKGTNIIDSKTMISSNNVQNATSDGGPPPDFVKLLDGLIKIQALIRGYLTRKRYQTLLPKVRVERSNTEKYKRPPPSQIISQLNQQKAFNTQRRDPDDIVMPPEELLEMHDLQNVNFMSLNQTRYHDKPTKQFATKSSIPPIDDVIEGFNWRQYFQEQELEEAYQNVEVEKEDDPQDNLSDGSSSNPSQDNFDMQEIYEQIYQAKNAEELAQRKEEAANRFLLEMNEQDFIDQQAMFQYLDLGFKGKRAQLMRSSINGVRYKGFQKGKSFKTEVPQKIASSSFSPDKALNRRPSFYDQRKEPEGLTRKPENMNLHAHQAIHSNEDQGLHPLTAHQIIDPNKLIIHQNSQTRIQTSNPMKGPYGMFTSQGPQHNKNMIQSLANGFGLNGINYGKKESIQQVIKDCFITKKIGNAQPTVSNNAAQQSYIGGSNLVQSQYHGTSEGSRVHSMNNYRHVVQRQLQSNNIFQGKKQQQSKKGNYTHKTPSQKLQEQREQIKQYFNQQGVPSHPGTSNEKFRAIIAGGKKQYPDNSGGGGSLHFDSLLTNQQPYGQLQNFQGHSIAYTNSQSFAGQPPLDGTTDPSSLFMKYVKSKIVKKVKTEAIPQQVADKYIDIYKELIDKEAQRKQEEQEFLRKHHGYNQPCGGFNATSSHFGGHSQNATNNNSRNTKTQARSDHHKSKLYQKSKLSSHHNHTCRKEPPIPLQFQFNQQHGWIMPQNSHKLDDLALIAANLHDLHFSTQQQQQLQNSQNQSIIPRSSIDGEIINQMKLQTFKINPSVNGSGQRSSQKAKLINNSESSKPITHFPSTVEASPDIQKHKHDNLATSSYQPAPISNSDNISPNVKLPLINPIHNSKLRSRELESKPLKGSALGLNSEQQISQMSQQLYDMTIGYQQSSSFYNQHANGNTVSIITNNKANQNEQKAAAAEFILKQENHNIIQEEYKNGDDNLNRSKSEQSMNSSIDEEMLDKIKTIYSDVRKHTQSSHYYNIGAAKYGNNSNIIISSAQGMIGVCPPQFSINKVSQNFREKRLNAGNKEEIEHQSIDGS